MFRRVPTPAALLLRYEAHAVALRTSDLDTEFFHTDMKVLESHFTISPLFFIAYPQTQVPAPSVLGPCAVAAGARCTDTTVNASTTLRRSTTRRATTPRTTPRTTPSPPRRRYTPPTLNGTRNRGALLLVPIYSISQTSNIYAFSVTLGPRFPYTHWVSPTPIGCKP